MRTIKDFSRIVIFCAITSLTTACSTYYGSANITSVPEGSEVINDKDGSLLGVTPLTVWWKDSSSRKKQMILQIRKDGFYTKTAVFWLSMRHKTKEQALQNVQLVKFNLLEKK
ncbi:MAG: hypothetical protein ACRBEE_08610 [Arenicella sp.]